MRLVHALCVATSLFPTAEVCAQSPAGQAPRDLILAPRHKPVVVATGAPRGYALIIGVSQYENLDETAQLRFPERDADASTACWSISRAAPSVPKMCTS